MKIKYITNRSKRIFKRGALASLLKAPYANR